MVPTSLTGLIQPAFFWLLIGVTSPQDKWVRAEQTEKIKTCGNINAEQKFCYRLNLKIPIPLFSLDAVEAYLMTPSSFPQMFLCVARERLELILRSFQNLKTVLRKCRLKFQIEFLKLRKTSLSSVSQPVTDLQLIVVHCHQHAIFWVQF